MIPLTLELDNEGFLKQLSDWSPEIADILADNEGITLTENHWEIINLLRDFYQQYQLSPSTRPLIKAITQKYGPEKGKSIYLMKLFPGSPAKLASKIAGLPKPPNCI